MGLSQTRHSTSVRTTVFFNNTNVDPTRALHIGKAQYSTCWQPEATAGPINMINKEIFGSLPNYSIDTLRKIICYLFICWAMFLSVLFHIELGDCWSALQLLPMQRLLTRSLVMRSAHSSTSLDNGCRWLQSNEIIRNVRTVFRLSLLDRRSNVRIIIS